MTLKTEGALIDSGATENFLDPRAVIKLRLPTEELQNPRNILNIDGTNNKAGQITRKCQLKVKLGNASQEMDFYVTNLGQDRIVLGYPFLRMFNPTINWSNGGINHLSNYNHPNQTLETLPTCMGEGQEDLYLQNTLCTAVGCTNKPEEEETL